MEFKFIVATVLVGIVILIHVLVGRKFAEVAYRQLPIRKQRAN